MFYTHFVLANKGPLSKIWLAAHWDKKLTKAHVFETNIESSIAGILQPKVKMALRTSGHLLLGIVRIYSRKAKYLLADCNEAFIKIKMAFRPGVVDLLEENREAAVSAITLPEVFHDFDVAVPDINIDMEIPITLNQSQLMDITLKEDYGNLTVMRNDDFGDVEFDDNEMARDATNIDEGFDLTSLFLVDVKKNDKLDDITQSSENASSQTESIVNNSRLKVNEALLVKDDGFDKTTCEGLLDETRSDWIESAGLFDDAPLEHIPLDSTTLDEEASQHYMASSQGHQQKHQEMSVNNVYGNLRLASVEMQLDTSIPEFVLSDLKSVHKRMVDTHKETEKAALIQQSTPSELHAKLQLDPEQSAYEQTILHNKNETFALAPLDATFIQGIEKTKTKRKRKLVVDEIKNISGEEIKAHLSDTSDIVTILNLAPPTKRLAHWKETSGVEKLFALPGHSMLSVTLSRLYQHHLSSQPVENEEFGIETDIMENDQKTEKLRESIYATLVESTEVERVDNNIPASIEDVEISHETSTFCLEEPEEQLCDETYEQFEERILNERIIHVLHIIKHCLQSGSQVLFSVLTKNSKRKQVAQKFYVLLVLKKQQAIELIQDKSYGELYISSGPKFSYMGQ